MKRFKLQECVERGIPPEKIVPDDFELYQKMEMIFNDPADRVELIKVYENMGGRFIERSSFSVPTADVEDETFNEEFDQSPLANDHTARRRLKHIWSQNPEHARSLMSWN